MYNYLFFNFLELELVLKLGQPTNELNVSSFCF